MHWYDHTTHETVFELTGESARPLTLVCCLGTAPEFEVPMLWVGGRWQVRVKLPDGFHCYGFRLGARVMPDRTAGRVRDAAGERRSLVVVPGYSALGTRPAVHSRTFPTGYLHA